MGLGGVSGQKSDEVIHSCIDAQGRKVDLTSDQKKIIVDALKSTHVETSHKKIHVKILSEDQFHVRVGKNVSFLVTRKKAEEIKSKEWITLKEPICERAFLSSCKNFWKSILFLFYSKIFHEHEVKPRVPLNALREDFENFSKSLAAGSSWVSEEHLLSKPIKDLVSRARVINNALHSRNQKKALGHIAKEWASSLSESLNWPGETVIPVGYLNDRGVLQPVLLRIFRDEKGCGIEIFNDTPESGARVSATERRRFLHRPESQELELVLNELFGNLVYCEVKKEGKGFEKSETFSEIFTTLAKTAQERMGIKETEQQTSSKEISQKKPPAGLRYGSTIAAMDKKMEGSWKLETTQEIIKPAQSAPHRVLKWFDHIVGHTLSPEEKVSLLFSMTVEWADRELKKITPAMNDFQKKEIYESVFSHVRHTQEKIAYVLTGGKVRSELVPYKLTEIEKTCEKNIKELDIQGRVEGKGSILNNAEIKEEEILAIPLVLTQRVASSAPSSAPLQTVNIPADIEARWKQSVGQLAGTTSPEMQKAYQRELALQVADQLKTKSSDMPESLKNKPVEEIFSSAADTQTFVHTVVSNFVKSGAFENLTSGIFDSKLFLSSEEIIFLLEKIILFPHSYPLIPPPSAKFSYTYLDYLSTLRRIVDPNMTLSTGERDTVQGIKALLQLHHGPSVECTTALSELMRKNMSDGIKKKDLKDLVDVVSKNMEPMTLPLVVGAAQGDEIREIPTKLCATIKTMTSTCELLIEAARAEKDVEKRKGLFQAAQDKSLEILKMLPPPGTEGSFGEESIWEHLSAEDRKQMATSMHMLQSTIWESQMQLGQKRLSGKARFLLIKGQAIGIALMRAEITREQRKLEDIFITASEKGVDLRDFHPFVFVHNKTKKIMVQWELIPDDLAKKLDGLPAQYKSDLPDCEILALDKVTCSTYELNAFLTQDLTTQLSGDATIEKDLTAVYHFIIRDFNRGRMIGGHDALQPSGHNETKQTRIPISVQKEPISSGGEKANIWREFLLKQYEMFKDCDRLHKKKPFLPVIDLKEKEPSEVLDIRTHGSLQRWTQYAVEESLAPKKDTEIPFNTQIFQELLKIRVEPESIFGSGNKTDCTSYSVCTATNALKFLADPHYITYFADEKVQKFLEESLFGPFLLQQAIPKFPDEIAMHCEEIGARIVQALSEDRPEVACFLRNVLLKVRSQVEGVERSLEEAGLFSGVIDRSPVYTGKHHGIIYSQTKQTSPLLEEDNAEISEYLDGEALFQPIHHHIKSTRSCLEKIDAVLAGISSKDFVQDIYIDLPKDPEKLRNYYIFVLSDFQARKDATCTFEELLRILQGYQLLCDPRIEGGSSERIAEASLWVRQKIVPQVHTFSEKEINQLCTELVNAELKKRGSEVSFQKEMTWTLQFSIPPTYRLTLPTGTVDIDLSSMDIINTRGATVSAKPIQIPDELLQREDVHKALKETSIKAVERRRGDARIYEWTYEDQNFSLTNTPSGVRLERTIDGQTYVYQSIKEQDKRSQAEALSIDNGIWMTLKKTDEGYIFPHGMHKHSEEEKFLVDVKNETVCSVRTSDGMYVSNEKTFDGPSPVPFASSENTIVMLDNDKKPKKIRFKDSELVLTKTDGTWECIQGEKNLGEVVPPPSVKDVEALFGVNWEEYVICVKKEDVLSYVLFPYAQTVPSDGEVEVLQEGTLPLPEIIEVREGIVSGSITGKMFIANRLLLEARNTKDQILARKKYLQANALLHSLQSERPPSSKKQLEAMASLFRQIEKQTFIDGEEKIPDPTFLAMNLRLLLTMRHLQNMQKETLLGSAGSRFSVTERMTKLYEMYCVMEKSQSFSAFTGAKAHAAVMLLDKKERAELSNIGDQLLHEITSDKNLATYFGMTSVKSVEMPRFDHIDPDCLLAILRHAQPNDPSFSIQKVAGQQSLDVLLGNFWSYVRSIHDAKGEITQEQLSFLFEQSRLPAAQSVEEESRLRRVDFQIRQFLLSYASAMQMRKQMPEEIETQVKKAKLNLGKIKDDKLIDFLHELRGSLGDSVDTMLQTVDKVSFNIEGARLEGEQGVKAYKDIKGQLQDVNNALVNVSNELDDVVRTAKNFVSDIETKKEELENEIRKLKKSIEQRAEELEKRLEELDTEPLSFQDRENMKKSISEEAQAGFEKTKEALEHANNVRDAFLSERVTDPLRQEEWSRKDVLEGYVAAFEIPKLESFAAQCDTGMRDIRDAVQRLGNVFDFLEKLKIFDPAVNTIITGNFAAQPGLYFPKGDKSREVLLKIIEGKTGKGKSALGLVREIVGEAGIVGAAKLGIMRLRYDPEKLKKQLENTGIVLGGIAAIPSLMPDLPPISLGKKSESQKPLEFEDVTKTTLAQRYLTENQIEALRDRLREVDSKKQQDFLSTLSSALEMKESKAAALVELGANHDAINRSYEHLKSEKTRGVSQSAWKPIVKKDSFDTMFSQYFEDVDPAAEKKHKETHEKLVDSLLTTVLPENEKSLYAKDLQQSITNLKNKDPLPYARRVNKDFLEKVEREVAFQATDLKESIEKAKKEILRQVKEMPLTSLPKEAQEIRLREGSHSELLNVICKQHRNNFFVKSPLLDTLISDFEINETRLKALTGKERSAQAALNNLKKLKDLKDESSEAQYACESNNLIDCLSRCQNTKTLESLTTPELAILKPYARKIMYFQSRLGMTLRDNQLEALAKMIEEPSLLKQLRMGLGKTDVLLPIALDILGAEGKIPIGIVPKALFTTNFGEMDDRTRLIFELAGNQLVFNRQSFQKPYSGLALHHLSQQCRDFLEALSRGEYVLTTIESKASIDNKITEVERSLVILQKKLSSIPKDDKNRKKEREALLQEATDHHKALGFLYKVKGVFELPHARLVIDEADQVGRANYSVNAEIGDKKPLAPVLCETIAKNFDIIRKNPKLKALQDQIASNNQFTLSEEVVNKLLQDIAEDFISSFGNLPAGLSTPENKEKLLKWFSGEKWPFPQVPRTSMGLEYMTLRKALNSSLRACLGLKIGLSADFDPLHGAIGIPASQGITSATTKFSDPLMQLCLSMMVSMYKPQKESFLSSQAAPLYDELSSSKDPEAKAAKAFLEKILERQKKGEKVSFHTELSDDPAQFDPVKMFLRQRFAMRVVDQRLIYISDSQIARPVQDTLRGCNVIGLTGTATRNLSHVITKDGMKSVSKVGRETTAEVLYRLVKSSPQGLETPVPTYSLDSKKEKNNFSECAKEGSGYNFIVNQAGACDSFSQKEIVSALHEAGNRPIIYLDVETGEKTVYIGKKFVLLGKLSEIEKKEVEEKGFYYYHTPHVRGTHFSIPLGSKGVLMLSPTVNANDRDQALYRARQLGAGHTVECRISEKQAEEIQKVTGKQATLGDVLKIHHNQTYSDEATEDLAAYRLHISGILTRAADVAKKNMRLDGEVPLEDQEDFLKAQADVVTCFQRFFVQASDNDTYIQKLISESMRGGEEPTKDHLKALVERQIKLADELIKKLNTIEAQLEVENKFFKLIGGVRKEIEAAKSTLENDELNKIETQWDDIQPQLPPNTAATPLGSETAETEAEEEQEVKAEVTAEQEGRRRKGVAGGVFEGIDEKLFQSITTENILQLAPDLPRAIDTKKTWSDTAIISNSIEYQYQQQGRTMISDVRIMVSETEEGALQVAFVDSTEVEKYMINIFPGQRKSDNKTVLFNKSFFAPVFDEKGKFTFKKAGAASGVQGKEQTPEAEVHMLLGMLYFGVSSLSRAQWEILENYWEDLFKENKGAELDALKTTFAARFEKSNPTLLSVMSDHLWDTSVDRSTQILKSGGLNLRPSQWTVLEKHWMSLPKEQKEAFQESFSDLRKSYPSVYSELGKHLWDKIQKISDPDEAVKKIKAILAQKFRGGTPEEQHIDREIEKIVDDSIKEKVGSELKTFFKIP